MTDFSSWFRGTFVKKPDLVGGHQMPPTTNINGLEMSQHDVNYTRRIRTEEYAKNINSEEAIKDPSFSYRSDVITTKLYCSCRDCVKFCCYNKPIKCIDPYLIDMRYTHWIYHGLVAASKTASVQNGSNESDESKKKCT